MTKTITIEKKVYDVLQKNNLDLMDKLEKAKKTLRIYANRSNWDADYTDSFCCTDGWEMARLKGNPKHEDSWVDIAEIAACGAEITE